MIASGGTAAPLIGYAIVAYGVYETGKTGYEIGSGKEAYTGRKLSNSERSEKAGELVGAVVGGGIGAKSVKGFKGETGSKAPVTDEIYQRPKNVTTKAQRANANAEGQTCVDCGGRTKTMVADHKKMLVEEFYETCKIDKVRMRSTDATQSQCSTCSAKQGAKASQYSKKMKAIIIERTKNKNGE